MGRAQCDPYPLPSAFSDDLGRLNDGARPRDPPELRLPTAVDIVDRHLEFVAWPRSVCSESAASDDEAAEEKKRQKGRT